MFKEGNIVIPKSKVLKEWPNLLTKRKHYKVTVHPTTGRIIVYADHNTTYWSLPHKYFDKIVPAVVIGGGYYD
jgi:hypothetical protein